MVVSSFGVLCTINSSEHRKLLPHPPVANNVWGKLCTIQQTALIFNEIRHIDVYIFALIIIAANCDIVYQRPDAVSPFSTPRDALAHTKRQSTRHFKTPLSVCNATLLVRRRPRRRRRTNALHLVKTSPNASRRARARTHAHARRLNVQALRCWLPPSATIIAASSASVRGVFCVGQRKNGEKNCNPLAG